MYRRRGKAEGHLGELMSVVAPALSSTSRRKSHYRGEEIRTREKGVDAFACNQVRLLLAGFGYRIMHIQCAVLERVTGTGWSLRRLADRVLRTPARFTVSGRRITMTTGGASAHWRLLARGADLQHRLNRRPADDIDDRVQRVSSPREHVDQWEQVPPLLRPATHEPPLVGATPPSVLSLHRGGFLLGFSRRLILIIWSGTGIIIPPRAPRSSMTHPVGCPSRLHNPTRENTMTRLSRLLGPPEHPHASNRDTPALRLRSAIVAVAALLAAACGDGETNPEPNRSPVASGTIPAQTVAVGESVTVNVTSAFSDPDGDALTYAATSSAPGVASVAVSGADVTVTGVSAGTASVTVTASDPDGLSAEQAFEVTVPNRAPVATDSIPAQTVEVGDSVSVDLAGHFSDPDGDALAYAATSSAPGVASVAVSGADVTVTGVSAGTANVTVTASDPDGLSAQQAFEVTVPNRAPVATDSIPAQTVEVGDSVSVDLAGHFSDPDGDALTYAATSSAPGLASVAVSGADVTVTGVSAGTASVTVTASDPDGLSAEQAFEVTVEPPNPDREALVALYNATDGPNWARNQGWLTDAPLGLWHGVKTDRSGRVTELDLEENELTGSIPPELGDLENLTVLSLYGNGLTGSIPPELGDLENLTGLDLAVNGLTGSIPPELGDLANLTGLYLDGNELTGSIPPELGDLANLTVLYLGFNELTGSIPPELGDLANLTELYLLGNELTGSIPPELGDLANLTVLYLAGNELTGSIPPELGDLANLTELYLFSNELTDPIPDSFLDLDELNVFYFAVNDGLCAPDTEDFRDWLDGMNEWSGAFCP